MSKIKRLNYDFEKFLPDEDTCLAMLFKAKFGSWDRCPGCYKRSKFHKVKNRKCFSCQWCGFQVHPLSGTIYHKSSTPLKKWFYAIYLFSRNNTISVKEIKIHIKVTYKTAWRILKLIRRVNNQQTVLPSKLVEINEQYITDFVEKMRNKKKIS